MIVLRCFTAMLYVCIFGCWMLEFVLWFLVLGGWLCLFLCEDCCYWLCCLRYCLLFAFDWSFVYDYLFMMWFVLDCCFYFAFCSGLVILEWCWSLLRLWCSYIGWILLYCTCFYSLFVLLDYLIKVAFAAVCIYLVTLDVAVIVWYWWCSWVRLVFDVALSIFDFVCMLGCFSVNCYIGFVFVMVGLIVLRVLYGYVLFSLGFVLAVCLGLLYLLGVWYCIFAYGLLLLLI